MFSFAHCLLLFCFFFILKLIPGKKSCVQIMWEWYYFKRVCFTERILLEFWTWFIFLDRTSLGFECLKQQLHSSFTKKCSSSVYLKSVVTVDWSGFKTQDEDSQKWNTLFLLTILIPWARLAWPARSIKILSRLAKQKKIDTAYSVFKLNRKYRKDGRLLKW